MCAPISRRRGKSEEKKNNPPHLFREGRGAGIQLHRHHGLLKLRLRRRTERRSRGKGERLHGRRGSRVERTGLICRCSWRCQTGRWSVLKGRTSELHLLPRTSLGMKGGVDVGVATEHGNDCCNLVFQPGEALVSHVVSLEVLLLVCSQHRDKMTITT